MADTPTDATAQTDADAVPNKVTVEDAGPSLKKLTIEVPAEVVDDTLSGSLDTLAHEAEIPGFRKGKAPRRLIERNHSSRGA